MRASDSHLRGRVECESGRERAVTWGVDETLMMRLCRACCLRRFLLCLLALAAQARAVIGLQRAELVRVYGAVQEEAKSVYGDQFLDLLFLARSTADGNSIIIAATMMDGRCHAVSYLKNDADGKPAPLTTAEVRNQMVASSRKVGGAWRQTGSKTWELDSGADGSRKLKAQWTKPELFQVFTEELLEKSPVKP